MSGIVGSAQGQWRGKARVRNLRTGREDILNLDVIAREPSRLRLEVTGAFGVHVASIALNGGEVRYVLTQEKKFVSAPVGSDAFERLVPVRISPSALLEILFDRELDSSQWICSRQSGGQLLSSCKHRQQNVLIKWMERKGRMRRLAITARDAEIELVIDEAKSKVEPNERAFELTAPEGFRTERLG